MDENNQYSTNKPQQAPPQNPVSFQHQNPYQQPQSTANSSKTWMILFIVLLIFSLLAGLFAVYTFSEQQKEITNLQSEINAANEKISQLDSPTKKINDEKRKADLAKFIAEVSKYKSITNNYPSTEPSLFEQDFGSTYLAKLTDFNDPNTKNPYEIVPVAPVQTPPGITLGVIHFQWPAQCAGSEFEDIGDESKAAARILLQAGDIYCQNIN